MNNSEQMIILNNQITWSSLIIYNDLLLFCHSCPIYVYNGFWLMVVVIEFKLTKFYLIIALPGHVACRKTKR